MGDEDCVHAVQGRDHESWRGHVSADGFFKWPVTFDIMNELLAALEWSLRDNQWCS